MRANLKTGPYMARKNIDAIPDISTRPRN